MTLKDVLHQLGWGNEAAKLLIPNDSFDRSKYLHFILFDRLNRLAEMYSPSEAGIGCQKYTTINWSC